MFKTKVGRIITFAVIAGLLIIGGSIGIGLGIKRPEKTYSVSIVSTVDGTKTHGAGSYKIGDEVTLEAEATDGYRFVCWKLGNAQVSTANPYTFKLTKNNIGNYSAVYEKEFNLTKATTENGTITVSVEKAIKSEIITVTATPAENYEIDKLYYVEEGSDEEVQIENRVFSMPEKNITVYATFKLVEYSILVGEIENGTIEVAETKASVGTEIHVTVTPDEGNPIYRVYYIDENDVETEIEEVDDSYVFLMPDKDIIIFAEFIQQI